VNASTTRWKALRLRLRKPLGKPAPDASRIDPAEAADTIWAETGPMDGASGRLLAATARRETVYDSQFDSRLDADQLAPIEQPAAHQQLLTQVLRGRADTLMPALTASYGPGASLRVDFGKGSVHLDLQAQRQLRLNRELPLPAPGAHTGATAVVRRLDEVIWDLGIAAAAHPLLNAPADWWHSRLVWAVDADMSRLSRLPRHLDMARHLAEQPLSPSELRRRARVALTDLRAFVQAGLLVGLLAWQPAASGAIRQP
jgi:hypothetical protein